MTEVQPYQVDAFSIVRLVADEMGEKTYMEILGAALGKDRMGGATPSVDKDLEKWPEDIVSQDCVVRTSHLKEPPQLSLLYHTNSFASIIFLYWLPVYYVSAFLTLSPPPPHQTHIHTLDRYQE
jgi:hypothetical protein